jgi:hypothetical protein
MILDDPPIIDRERGYDGSVREKVDLHITMKSECLVKSLRSLLLVMKVASSFGNCRILCGRQGVV